ncbi:olfactory receptor 6B1-like [Terrapene carolina triunguis]|uniref:olfactory receptor 6B1-like n=1 Tax=Terrapene triunguis TaxID=2587831 RepID=UPI0011569954|nr:olfactory receptor 6B1-like [Terrapene carolina triunguis]XP_029770259.1 olfactory receptor 6B1-like [Terrapene carolina triunguis]
MANATIIATVWKDRHLHTPMFFFLSNFSFMEIWYIMVTMSKMLFSLMVERTTISVWLCDFIGHLPLTISTTQFLFCGPNKINQFFCDLAPVLNLSCTDTSVSEMIFFTFAWVIIFCSFLLTMVSIIFTICMMSSTTGRQRAFSTCASHLTMVIIFYSTVTFMYICPMACYTFLAEKVVSIFYCVVTPLLNPVIYNPRNKKVKEVLGRVLCSRRRLNWKMVGFINWDSSEKRRGILDGFNVSLS